MFVRRNVLYASVLGLLFVSAPAAPIHAAVAGVDVLCDEHGAPSSTARGTGNVRPERDTRGIVADSEIPAGQEPATSAAFQATVPVWVHVLAASTNPRDGWVSDRQITAQIQVLDDAFAGRYGGADTGFRFTHAGTTRTVNPEWFAMETFESEMAAKTALRRGDATTLNIYLNSGAGYLGWAYYPKIVAGEPYQALDGAVVHFDSLPGGKIRNYNLGHTATHEVGHWLGLAHTFEGGCGGHGDHVDDTPAQAVPTSGCPEGKDTCSAPGNDPIHNFMDYSYDGCYTQFTLGQATRGQQQWLHWRVKHGY